MFNRGPSCGAEGGFRSQGNATGSPRVRMRPLSDLGGRSAPSRSAPSRSSAAACVSELLTDCGVGSSGGRSRHHVPVNQPSLETATLACLAWENLENHREGLAGTLAEMGRAGPGAWAVSCHRPISARDVWAKSENSVSLGVPSPQITLKSVSLQGCDEGDVS